jgi:hypothetical protein
MIPGDIEKNLLLLLDPLAADWENRWRFVECRHTKDIRHSTSIEDKSKRTVYWFSRRSHLIYLLFSWYARRCKLSGVPKKILYVNDGLMSSLFDSEDAACYRLLVSHHMPAPSTLRQKLIWLLPTSLRAEKRYIVMQENNYNENSSIDGSASLTLDKQNFMFYSNVQGKLMLTSADTLRSGKGSIIKTTANLNYAGVMEKEFRTIFHIANLQGKAISIPPVGKLIKIRNRPFFAEEYVRGRNLREIIHALSNKNNLKQICVYLDRLQNWFATYRSFFHEEPCRLESCYDHLFKAYRERYASHLETPIILQKASEIIDDISKSKTYIVPIFSHNDLWPGNFIVHSDNLVAVDWERAVPGRAPLFDIYWMMISLAMEYIVCSIGSIDYVRAFRQFLSETDEVSRYAVGKLKLFLESIGLPGERHQHFLFLFLMEWSVQGYFALGHPTEMDDLAYEELLRFLKTFLESHQKID